MVTRYTVVQDGQVYEHTYINGLITIQNESSEKPNAFDISLFNCGEKKLLSNVL